MVGALGRFLKALGAVPVGGSPTKAVQAIQRGNMDCMAGPISWLQSFGMWDITKHVLDAPLAIQATPSVMVINRDAWKQLSRAEKVAMIKHAPQLTANTTINGYMAEDVMVRALAPKRGLTITKARAVRPALEVHKAKELKIVPAIAIKQGVKTAQRIVDAHLRNVAKWQKIHARIGNDVDKFAQALWDEVFSKLDPDKL